MITIFSALTELNQNSDINGVTVLAIRRKGIKFDDSLWCIFKDKSRTREYIIRSTIEVIPTHDKPQGFGFEPVVITCDLRDIYMFADPSLVKIRHKDTSSGWIRVKVPSTASGDPVMCVLPLEKDFNNINHILEFMAYYMVNGINRFEFFDAGIVSEVWDALHSFRSKADVEVHPIVLPGYITHSVSQSVLNAIATHFCLRSFVNQPQIVVTINDLIAPRKYRLQPYISKKLSESNDVAALVVPMVLFCQENQKHFTELEDGFRTSMVHQTQRQVSIFPHHVHSRVIVLRPRMVKFLGGHFTLEMNPMFDGKEEDTDSDEVLLFNYKPCGGILTKSDIKKDVMVDNRLELFRDEIVEFVSSNVKS